MVPVIRASAPSSMSASTKNVQTIVPANRWPVGNSHSAPAVMPTVPVTVIAFGVTGVRASTCPTGISTRFSTGRRKFSMAVRSYWRVGHGRVIPVGGLLSGGREVKAGCTQPDGPAGGDTHDRQERTDSRRRQHQRQASPAAFGMSRWSAIREQERQRWSRRFWSHTGAIQRAGRVEDGTTVSDFDEVEVRQQRSVNLTLAPVSYAGVKVNLIDTPGLRRLHRGPAGRPAGRGRGAVRRARDRGRGRPDPDALG